MHPDLTTLSLAVAAGVQQYTETSNVGLCPTEELLWLCSSSYLTWAQVKPSGSWQAATVNPAQLAWVESKASILHFKHWLVKQVIEKKKKGVCLAYGDCGKENSSRNPKLEMLQQSGTSDSSEWGSLPPLSAARIKVFLRQVLDKQLKSSSTESHSKVSRAEIQAVK